VNLTLRQITRKDSSWIHEFLRRGGADFIVSRGRKIFPAEIEGYCAENSSGRKIGLVTFEFTADQCEVVTLDAFEQFQGIGTALINQVIETVRKRDCHRVWLITTNDNIDAIRFYQRRGFVMCAIYKDALELSRKLKPSIPLIGCYGINMRDELEFEMKLD
jgi:N-acetylglutamate synthase-like GNAT family acetyltransferase